MKKWIFLLIVMLGWIPFASAQRFSIAGSFGYTQLIAIHAEVQFGDLAGLRINFEPNWYGWNDRSSSIVSLDGVIHLSTDEFGSNVYFLGGLGLSYSFSPLGFPSFVVFRLGVGFEWHLDPNVGWFIEIVPRFGVRSCSGFCTFSQYALLLNVGTGVQLYF